MKVRTNATAVFSGRACLERPDGAGQTDRQRAPRARSGTILDKIIFIYVYVYIYIYTHKYIHIHTYIIIIICRLDAPRGDEKLALHRAGLPPQANDYCYD